MKNTIHLTYTMTFDSSFHIGTGLRRGLIDRGVARDGAGYLYIPGSTIKGILREKCEHLALNPVFHSERLQNVQSPHARNLRSFARQQTIVEHIFGSQFREGTLYFDNALLQEKTTTALGKDFFQDSDNDPHESSQKAIKKDRFQQFQVEVRSRNCISRRTGTAVEQALFRSEYGIRDIGFTGQISGFIEGIQIPGENVTYALVLFVTSLGLFESIGANKSVGMGKFSLHIQDADLRIDDQPRSLPEFIELLDALKDYDKAVKEAS